MNKFISSIVAVIAVFAAGMAMAASTTTLEEDSVAAIGTVTSAGVDTFTAYYASLPEAFAALENGTKTAGYKLTLLKDVELSDGISFNNKNSSADLVNNNDSRREWYIIDLNNHKITLANGTKYLLTVTASATSMQSSIGIRNGTLEATGTTLGALNIVQTRIPRLTNVTMSSENDKNPTCVFGVATSNCLVKDCTITNGAADVGLSILGKQALVHNSTIICESGTALYVEQTDSTRTGTAVAKSTIKGTTAVEVGENASEFVYLTGGTYEGEIVDPAECLWISGGTYTTDPDYYHGAGYTAIDNEDGTYTVVEDNAVTVDGEVSSISDAFAVKGKTGERTIQLQDDIFLLALDEGVNAMDIGAGMTVTIDLNGFSLRVFDISACYKDVKCAEIKEGGTLNITDTSEDKAGYVGFYAWLMDFRNADYNGPKYANNMITLAGKMNIDAGTLDNQSLWCCGYTLATYTVDIYPGYSATKLGGQLAISGKGTLLHTNTAIRMFTSDYDASVTMTGGKIDGGLTAIWQNGCYKATIDISGGELIGTGDYGVIYNQYEEKASSSTTTISGGTFTGTLAAYSYSYHPAGWFKITGGSFIDPDNQEFYVYGQYDRIVVSGGVFDRGYMSQWNYMKCYAGYENYYASVKPPVGKSLVINEDNRYCFDVPVASLMADICKYKSANDGEWYTTYCKNISALKSYDPIVVDHYSSLPMALSDCGVEQEIRYGNNFLIGRYIEVIADGDVEQPRVFNSTWPCEVYMNGHSVISHIDEPLITIDGKDNILTFADAGSITSDGLIFASAIDSTSRVDIYDGDYTTNGKILFSGNVKIKADVGDGSYFDVNPASFSHDVSSFVYNAPNAIEFKTLQATAVDNRWYLGRNVEVVKEQN